MRGNDSVALPLVSAVIPTRNRPDFVVRAVRCVLSQTYSNLEVIVVVDGPDSATQTALHALNDPRVRIIPLVENVGGSEARNTGVRAARGNWVALLDDDDEWFPEKIEKQVELALASEARLQLISSMLLVRSSEEDTLWPITFPQPSVPVSEYLFCRRGLGFGGGLLQTSTLLASKELLLTLPFQAGLRMHQDWDWVLRVGQLQAVRIDMVRECLAVWNVEGGRKSISRSAEWEFSLEWVRSRRALFTPRAYSYFIATECARSAAMRHAPISVMIGMLRECLSGAPDLNCLLYFAKVWLIPQNLRRFLRTKLGLGEPQQITLPADGKLRTNGGL
jgi:glycosyltransferase involved in cell wall biosynthesis